MKIVSEKPLPHGRRRIVVEIGAGEELAAIRAERYYRLGEPCDDQVLLGDILANACLASWCPIEQKWVS